MAMSDAERNVRSALPIIRLLQAYMPLSAARWAEKNGNRNVQVPPDITHQVIDADGVRCEWFIPPNSLDSPVLLYLHGGGFIYGMSSFHRSMVIYLARKAGMRALMVDYRLAPEHPFPAALEDCATAFRWLVKQGIAGGQIAIAGDSAGGNLTISTLMTLRDSGDPLPAAVVCLSPVSDLTGSGGLAKESPDPLLHPRSNKRFRRAYIAHHDPNDPLLSPVFGDWHGLPPLLIHAGEDEILHDDAMRMAQAAQSAGVDTQIVIYPGMWHVWQINLQVPQAMQSLDEIAAFLQVRLP